MFKIGQLVECIESTNQDFMKRYGGGDNVFKGEIYTVSHAYTAPDDVQMIQLYECHSPETAMFYPGFTAKSFRPLVSTDKKVENRKVINKLLDDALKAPEKTREPELVQ